MPGFIDVTGWTAEEVKRLGQIDEDEGWKPKRNYRYGYKNYQRVSNTTAPTYSVADAWAAACAAQRVNGTYYKEPAYRWDEATQTSVQTHRRNRDIMMEFLANPGTITQQDRDEADRVRDFIRNDLTFRALKGQLTEFDTNVSKVLAVENEFDSAKHRYELAIMACLPNSARRQEQRQTADTRMKFATGGLIGQPGQKVTLNIEVVSAGYSQQYNIYWVRGVTDQDQPVLFSNKEKFDAGTHLTVQGKVKAHRDNLTQLNYVKVL